MRERLIVMKRATPPGRTILKIRWQEGDPGVATGTLEVDADGVAESSAVSTPREGRDEFVAREATRFVVSAERNGFTIESDVES